MKTLAVGDIHTKSWILYEVAEIIDLFDHVVFCGDYADNWNTPPTQSMATWRILKEMVESDPKKIHAVIGNHDYAYIHPEIAGRSSGWSPVTFTLLNAPDNKALKNFLLSLPAVFELDGVTFSHAGVTEQWNGDESVYGLWQDNSPIWARPREFGGNITYKNIPQVIGHNSSPKIWNPQENIWCIDTFSENSDNTPHGDQTMLEIIDGKEFNVINIKDILYEDNNSSTSIENQVS